MAGEKAAAPCKELRIKLMIVGQENVGKTSLLLSLRDAANNRKGGMSLAKKFTISVGGEKAKKKFSDPQIKQQSGDTLSTDGIDIEQIKLETMLRNERAQVTYTVFDFAGQDIYYTTHSFFLSERSIFLIVWNLMDEDKEARILYWLHSIKVHAPKAPIVLIGTHLDEKKGTRAEINDALSSIYKKYKRDFPKIKSFHAVSCANNRGIDELLRNLEEIALAEPTALDPDDLPNSYRTLEEFLVLQKQVHLRLGLLPVIQWKDFISMAEKCKVIEPHNSENAIFSEEENDKIMVEALNYIHLLGSVLYYHAESPDNRLIVLDPQWITKVFATIVTTKHGFAAKGVIPVPVIRGQLWRSYSTDIHDALFSIFETFEIFFRVKSENFGDSLARTNSFGNLASKVSVAKLAVTPTPAPAPAPGALKAPDANSIKRRPSDLRAPEPEAPAPPPAPPLPSFLSGASVEVAIVPHLLPKPKPDIVSVFPRLDLCSVAYQRQYTFAFVPQGMFSRFLFRLHSIGTGLRYWKEGILVTNAVSSAYALVELKPQFCILSVQVRGTDQAAPELFQKVIEILENLLDVGFRMVPTAIAYIEPRSKKTFTQVQVEEASVHGNWVLTAPDGSSVKMDTIAPELALFNLQSLELEIGNQVKIVEHIGEGAFATVFRGEDLRTGEAVAIKQLNMEGKDDSERKAIFDEFRRELMVMSELKHKNIIKLIGFSLQLPYSMVMNLADKGSLYTLLEAYRNNSTPAAPQKKKSKAAGSEGGTVVVGWPLRLRIAYDIASALAYLHNLNYLHRDLKSPNVLIKATDFKAPVVALVSDFGITGKMFGKKKEAESTAERAVQNPTWLAPEILRAEPYATSADVYPFGLILWELATSKHPFAEFEFGFSVDLEDAIKSNKRPTIPSDISADYVQLMTECWADKPQSRPSFPSILDKLTKLIEKLAPELVETIKELKSSEAEETARKKAEHDKYLEEQKKFAEALKEQQERKQRELDNAIEQQRALNRKKSRLIDSSEDLSDETESTTQDTTTTNSTSSDKADKPAPLQKDTSKTSVRSSRAGTMRQEASPASTALAAPIAFRRNHSQSVNVRPTTPTETDKEKDRVILKKSSGVGQRTSSKRDGLAVAPAESVSEPSSPNKIRPKLSTFASLVGSLTKPNPPNSSRAPAPAAIYSKLTEEDLKQLLASRNVEFTRGLPKDDLIALIMEADKPKAPTQVRSQQLRSNNEFEIKDASEGHQVAIALADEPLLRSVQRSSSSSTLSTSASSDALRESTTVGIEGVDALTEVLREVRSSSTTSEARLRSAQSLLYIASFADGRADLVRSGAIGYLTKAFTQLVRKERKEAQQGTEPLPVNDKVKTIIITLLNNVQMAESSTFTTTLKDSGNLLKFVKALINCFDSPSQCRAPALACLANLSLADSVTSVFASESEDSSSEQEASIQGLSKDELAACVTAITALLSSTDTPTAASALALLTNLSTIPKLRRKIASTSTIKSTVAIVSDPNSPVEILLTACALLSILSSSPKKALVMSTLNIEEVLAKLPFLVELESIIDDVLDNVRSALETDMKKASRKPTEAESPSAPATLEHDLVVYSFKTFHWCNLCSKFIAGLRKQGYRCTKCHYACHDACKPLVDSACPGFVITKETKE